MTIHFVQFVVEIQTVRCHADSPKLSLPLRQRGERMALPDITMAATVRSPAPGVGYHLLAHYHSTLTILNIDRRDFAGS